MCSKKVNELIHEIRLPYNSQGVKFSDLPEGLLPTDVFNIIHKEEPYYEEDRDFSSKLFIYRLRDKTPEELEKDLEREERRVELNKAMRYESYLRLKKEFGELEGS